MEVHSSVIIKILVISHNQGLLINHLSLNSNYQTVFLKWFRYGAKLPTKDIVWGQEINLVPLQQDTHSFQNVHRNIISNRCYRNIDVLFFEEQKNLVVFFYWHRSERLSADTKWILATVQIHQNYCSKPIMNTTKVCIKFSVWKEEKALLWQCLCLYMCPWIK